MKENRDRSALVLLILICAILIYHVAFQYGTAVRQLLVIPELNRQLIIQNQKLQAEKDQLYQKRLQDLETMIDARFQAIDNALES